MFDLWAARWRRHEATGDMILMRYADDISDLGAVTIGGMGMSPSAELGDGHGFFQASHGSAPDIAGKGVANPYGTVLAAALMLNWLGRRHADSRLIETARRIEAAVTHSLADRSALSRDIGGTAGSQEITDVLCARLREHN